MAQYMHLGVPVKTPQPNEVYSPEMKLFLTDPKDHPYQYECLRFEPDSQIGDGDHGTTMVKVMEKVRETAESYGGGDFKGMLSAVGMAVLNMGGGATVPLFGSLFSGMARAIPEGVSELTKEQLAEALKSGEARLLKFSKAPLGAKTMVDALTPAVAAFAECGGDIAASLEAARLAAHVGCM